MLLHHLSMPCHRHELMCNDSQLRQLQLGCHCEARLCCEQQAFCNSACWQLVQLEASTMISVDPSLHYCGIASILPAAMVPLTTSSSTCLPCHHYGITRAGAQARSFFPFPFPGAYCPRDALPQDSPSLARVCRGLSVTHLACRQQFHATDPVHVQVQLRQVPQGAGRRTP